MRGLHPLRIAGALFMGAALAAGITAAFPASAQDLPCGIQRNNIEGQDYDRWASPISSHLVPLEDGTYMCVQAGSGIDGLLVEYYDRSFRLTGSRMVAPELPLYGGFYAAEDGYFLVTGQDNPLESADLPVIRVTRYDQDWNRTGRAEIRDCNTVLPFRAGTVRMDACGKYLVVRMGRRMCRTGDGKNHQANMTFEVNRKNMKVTDLCADVKAGVGYVSHSFNQFVKMDGNQAVAVDHGDAYPRAVVLTKYLSDASDGRFQPSGGEQCKTVEVLPFAGNKGDNETGAAIGGFEVSDTSYLIAGHSAKNPGSGAEKTRNVFVASVDRDTLKVKMHWLTSYADGGATTSTPQMVKLSGRELMVLWSKENEVYYVKINSRGKRISDVYKCPGYLSDCPPVLAGGKVLWYTCKNEKVVFYRIDKESLGCTVKAAGTGSPAAEGKKVSKGRAASYKGGRYIVTKSGRSGTAEAAFRGMDTQRKHAVIPDAVMIGGVRCKVTSIAAAAFEKDTSLVKVTVGRNIRKIGRNAFRGCRKLKRIVLRTKKLKTVGRGAIKGISSKAVIRVPEGRKRAYRKLFRKRTGFLKTMKAA